MQKEILQKQALGRIEEAEAVEIRQLMYFVEVARLGSYTRAAERLYVSQPSLSKAVRKLAEEIGAPLFEPKQKKPVLTYAGQRLFESAQRMIAEYEGILSELQGPMSTYRGRVTVGIPPLICTCFFAPIIAGFRELYPGIEISVAEKGAKSIQDAVDQELLDVGIVILPVYDGRFEVTPLFDDELVLVAASRDPLAGREGVTFPELRNEKLVLFNDEYMLRHQITANCREVGFEPYVWAESGQWDYLTELAAQNLGVTILPRPIFRNSTREDIRLVRLDHPRAGWQVVAIIKKDGRKRGAAKRFVRYAMENIQK